MARISRIQSPPNWKLRCPKTLSLFQILLALTVCRAQPTNAGLPPSRPFTSTTIALPQFRDRFEQALNQRAKEMALDSRVYGEAVSHVVELVQLCSSLTVAQLTSVSRSYPAASGDLMYLPPKPFLLEGGKYKDCETSAGGKLFTSTGNSPEIVFVTSVTGNWAVQKRMWDGPKMHIWAYFKKPAGAPPLKSMSEWGELYGILNADINDGTTPATAPPRKSIAEIMQENQERAKERNTPGTPVPGEFVCPGMVLNVQIHNDVFNTYTSMPNLTVKQPTRIARVDGSGKWFQVAGVATAVIGLDPARVYYHIASGRSRPSCPQE